MKAPCKSVGSKGLLRPSRRGVLAMGGAAATSLLSAPMGLGQSKPFAGVTLAGATYQHPFTDWLMDYIPEFEEDTGINVEIEVQSFPVYNQRMDLELSTGGRTYDFCNITFIYTGRWIGSGWMMPLDDFLNDPNKTPADWDPKDFMEGPQGPLLDDEGRTYGFAWEAGAMMMGAARGDILDREGLAMPTTFDELLNVCKATHDIDGVSAFVNDKLHHWNFIPYLMGYGGNVFESAPDNLMPMLDSNESIAAAEYYSGLLRDFGPAGVLSYTNDQAVRAQLTGRSNFRTQAIDWFTALDRRDDSEVRETARYAPMPVGPAGDFAGSSTQGFGIPVGSPNPDAAWEFIKWAMSKETMKRLAVEKGYGTVSRRSVITDPEYRDGLMLNGFDVSDIFLNVLENIGKNGYMKYRTVSIFPQVGDKINKAIESIVSGQMSAGDAMKQAQSDAILDIRKAGIKI